MLFDQLQHVAISEANHIRQIQTHSLNMIEVLRK